MKDNFIRVAAATPEIKVADVEFNKEQIMACVKNAVECQAKIIVLPELCLTGYTCNDLFLQTPLLEAAKRALAELISYSVDKKILMVVGLPYEVRNRLYNVAAMIYEGKLLAMVTKTHLPMYSEFYETRHFAPGPDGVEWIRFPKGDGVWEEIPFGSKILLECDTIPELVVAGEICEDVWAPNPPSISHALAGATVIVNPSASDETTGKSTYRRQLIGGQAARLVCGYIYSNAGEGESTQDLVFSAHNLICENGTVLAESETLALGHGVIYADMDLERLRSERRRMGTFDLSAKRQEGYEIVHFSMKKENLKLQRFIDPMPFVPGNQTDRAKRCEEILSIQAMGLKKRLKHTNCHHAVVGLSGGLDSTLALLVIARAFDALGLSREGIEAVTMPCFGTTDRTYQNACTLAKQIGANLTEINLRDAVNQHFKDIGHDPNEKDVTYENGQARERTQVLMDIANQCNGMVVGTGDLSELALGWATYNGDHMSMYGVNASVPKTLVRHLVQYYADTCEDVKLRDVLYDVLNTPVSPELLPPKDGEIAQKTEDIVGPYELHDFFLYHILRFGYHPSKVYRMAVHAFDGTYDKETILKWMKIFYRRFFTQQFKRSCLPDGPKVGSVAVSPRGDLRMPSDASSRLWLLELEQITIQ